MAEYIEQITWHEVTCRALTEEEKAEYAKNSGYVTKKDIADALRIDYKLINNAE